jgi:hypothetical protein
LPYRHRRRVLNARFRGRDKKRRLLSLVFGLGGNICWEGLKPREGNSMAKWLLILLLPIGLAGCLTEQKAALPMALGPSDSGSACLTYGDTPAYGDCKGPSSVSVSQRGQ